MQNTCVLTNIKTDSIPILEFQAVIEKEMPLLFTPKFHSRPSKNNTKYIENCTETHSLKYQCFLGLLVKVAGQMGF